MDRKIYYINKIKNCYIQCIEHHCGCDKFFKLSKIHNSYLTTSLKNRNNKEFISMSTIKHRMRIIDNKNEIELIKILYSNK